MNNLYIGTENHNVRYRVHCAGPSLFLPLQLIDRWDNHAAAFFTPFVFTLGTLGTNISTNSRGGGSAKGDSCEVRASQKKTSFHGNSLIPNCIVQRAFYTVFLGPITGIMITDVRFRSSSLSTSFQIDGGYCLVLALTSQTCRFSRNVSAL